jgi:hypothetical protein
MSNSHHRLKLTHLGIDTGVEEFFFTFEIEIEGPFRDADFGGNTLHFILGVAVLGKHPCCRCDDGLPAPGRADQASRFEMIVQP